MNKHIEGGTLLRVQHEATPRYKFWAGSSGNIHFVVVGVRQIMKAVVSTQSV